MNCRHVPVMLQEAVDSLNCKKGRTIVDCTLGGAGHAERIAREILPGGLLIGIDKDAAAVENARKQLAVYGDQVCLVQDSFANFSRILADLKVPSVDGVLLDLGLSLDQLETSGRGFSFSRKEPLDMRMDTRQEVTAEQLVNAEKEKGLAKLFKEYGEERYAERIARRIVRERQAEKITSSQRLAEIVSAAYPSPARHKLAIHPATRVFMALRIAVNRELDDLRQFLETVLDCLVAGARICVITFHSLEDRMVKRQMKFWEQECVCPPNLPVCRCDKKKEARRLTKRGQVPTAEEVAANPLARSARLRVAEKI